MKVAVVQFPASNCDQDALHAVRLLGHQAEYAWHAEPLPPAVGAVIVPGGFSFGDYLRAGAIARFSPVMSDVIAAAGEGMPVLGICNGFQVLCECGLLPGALVRNAGQKFVCKDVWLRVEDTSCFLTRGLRLGHVLRIPIAHGEGNYVRPAEPVNAVFRYCSPHGDVDAESNPNGSEDNIAGIRNGAGNVVGMMPHPERACDALLGSADGRLLLESFLRAT